MNKHSWFLAALMSLAAASPALAQYGSTYDTHTDYTFTEPQEYGFQYRPFHFQIEGGPTITQRTAATNLDNGFNVGAGITMYPFKVLPFGIRADASYSKFDARQALLSQGAALAQTSVDNGTVHQWGGDLDGEIDLPLGPRTRLYLLAGVGWYKEQETFRDHQLNTTTICEWWGCAQGYVASDPIVYRQTGSTQFAKNAGIGMEFAMAPGASFFIEARYMRIGPSFAKFDYIPVRFGVRF